MIKIKRYLVASGPVSIIPIDDRWYEIPNSVEIFIELEGEGMVIIRLERGFRFDGRSGGPLADFIVPNLGNQRLLACWLVHDVMGYGVLFGFEDTNEILRQMLILAGESRWKARLVGSAVGLSRSWYGEPLPGDREYANLSKIHIRHNAV